MNKRDADDASTRGFLFLARRTRRVSAFPRKIYSISLRRVSLALFLLNAPVHIDTCVNQRVVTRRGKCEKRNKRG